MSQFKGLSDYFLTRSAGAEDSQPPMEPPIIQEDCDLPVVSEDSGTWRRTSCRLRTSSACRDDRVRPSGSFIRFTVRSSGPRRASRVIVEISDVPVPPAALPEVSVLARGPRPSTAACDITGSLDWDPRPLDPVPPAALPEVSVLAPGLRPPTAPLHHDGPLKIHNLSVEEHRRLYHQVVDDMLKFQSGHRRPYSLYLGRVVKQMLWETLERPLLTETVGEDRLVRVDESHGVGGHPPLHLVDVSGEPRPTEPTTGNRDQI
ncbi:putative protein C22orf31 [Liparis tanakae]|uniref:Uncharacterized protein n=1 Tax=Liparis tanakae TaxID=230148 RepID=A0A4Z2GII8_9TELE|nr:putative protein C22orf31 [Liparis tanakae]